MSHKKRLQVITCSEPLRNVFPLGSVAEYDFTGNGIAGSEGKACNVRVSSHEVWSIEERNDAYAPWPDMHHKVTHAIIANHVLVTFKEVK